MSPTHRAEQWAHHGDGPFQHRSGPDRCHRLCKSSLFEMKKTLGYAGVMCYLAILEFLAMVNFSPVRHEMADVHQLFVRRNLKEKM